MHCYVALYVSTVFVVAGCGGGIRTSSVAFSDVAVSFAKSTPVPSRASTSVSECATAAECQRACEGGQIPACTAWGDMLYDKEPARAEALWLAACQRQSGSACVRMMALAAAEPRLADAYARHACAYGATDTCGLLGTILLLRGLGSAGGQQEALLRDGTEIYEMACGFEHWQSCLWAGQVYEHEVFASQPNSRGRLFARAFELATHACLARDYDACLFRGQMLDEIGELDDARESYTRGCQVFIEAAPSMPYKDAIREPPCRRASELAVVPSPESIVRTESPGSPHESQVAVEARRITGTNAILPPLSVRLEMQRQEHPPIGAHVKLCLSSSGLVENLRFSGASGFPSYDLELLETIRTWRYRPFMIDGKASPVCTRLTFTYSQNN